MRAFVKTESTKINIKADTFKVEGECVYVLNGDKIVAIVKLKDLVEAHLSEERKGNYDN